MQVKVGAAERQPTAAAIHPSCLKIFMTSALERWIPRLRASGQLRLMRALGAKAMTHRLETGERMRLRTDDILTKALLQERVFEPAVRSEIESRVEPGMTVLDIGANIGYFTLRFASLVGRQGTVVAFEPNPQVINELEFNLRLNDAKQVRIMRCALSEEDGQAEFCFPVRGMEAHGSLRPNDLFKVQSRQRVEVRRLDSILTELNVGRINFVKMDVEGAERLVIRGAPALLAQSPAPVFIFEAAEHLCRVFGYRLFELLTEFESRGYHVREADYGCWVAEKMGDTAA